MKLRDLVANSLPRVRGRKKKATASAEATTTTTPTAATGIVGTPDVTTNRSGYDKNQNRFPSTSSRGGSRESSLDGISEASWRGNALYRGLDTSGRLVEGNSRMMASSFTSSHGIVTSHSAEGFSSQLMMMSRSYDSRMAVSDYNGSCSQMSSISETAVEPYSAQQQYYHCYYHRHNHHHHHYHHVHAKPMTPLAQNQQEINGNACSISYRGRLKSEEVPKSEPGFFRKSIASFRSIRKHSSKNNKDSSAKPNGPEPLRCSVCPYPETNVSSTERKSVDKRPAKPKRKGLKGFSRSKENKEVFATDKCDKSWYSDNDTNTVASPPTGRFDPGISMFAPHERSRVRECSVESCSSRLYGSREGSSVREADLTGFDSASLSGYESDLPRGKVHRSRSRIKTNPWLPSPQPSLSGGRRSENCDLRESTEEDAMALEEQASRFPRSASFEHQRSCGLSLQYSAIHDNSYSGSGVQRQRSLTPNDVQATMSLDRATKSPPVIKKSTWWTVNRQTNNQCQSTTAAAAGGAAVTTLNDLNSDAPKSRPTSIVSPNSEFVMLADNLEQLANNISFEYEEMLDSTLESVSVCQEDGQASIQELLTDEENGNVTKKSASMFLKSDGGIHNAHSPDSGIGGLGSSDGDDALTPSAQAELKCVSMDCTLPSRSLGILASSCSRNSSQCLTYSQNSNHDNSIAAGKTSGIDNLRQNNGGFVSNVSNSCSCHSHGVSSKHKGKSHKRTVFEEDSSATVSESDIDNTSYNDNAEGACSSPSNSIFGTKKGSPLPKCKTESRRSARTPTLMVEERLDIQFQPQHRQFHGAGIVMGAGASMNGHSGHCDVGAAQIQAMSCRLSDPTDVIPRKVTRPCALRTNPSIQGGRRKFNDMEKDTTHNEHGRPWSDEFDFPRNITLNECVESPTENWQCDGQFSMSSSQDTVILEQRFEQAALENRDQGQEAKFENDNDYIRNEELIVKLDEIDAASTSQNTAEMASENTSLMDCNLDKLETGSHDASFEMSDACVQTDFDDDFSRWDEVDTLESLEENAIDPAESTRIWLLTGNMQGSADTGYSSLTRDSQILMDEDTLFLAGELEEKAAAERLSYAESSNKSSGDDRTPRNSAQYEINSLGIVVPVEKRCPPHKDCPIPSGGTHPSKSPTESGDAPGLIQNIPVANENQRHAHGPALRAIPQSTVNQMFSNIESQFQEIFQQIYDQENMSLTGDAKRSSSDSSDSTLKSSGSDGPIAGGIPKSALGSLQTRTTKDSKTDDCSERAGSVVGVASGDVDMYSDHDYVNIPSSNPAKTVGSVHPVPQSNNPSGISEKDANGNPVNTGVKTKPERPSNFPESYRSINTESNQSTRTGSQRIRAASNSERADYLEFLKDAPLNRSHLKRPLFLVPGIGPVDMSCSEQVNLFSEASKPVTKASATYGNGNPLSASESPSMSPSTSHNGKKLKFKKGSHHKTLGEFRVSSPNGSNGSDQRDTDRLQRHPKSPHAQRDTKLVLRNDNLKTVPSNGASGGGYTCNVSSNKSSHESTHRRCRTLKPQDLHLPPPPSSSPPPPPPQPTSSSSSSLATFKLPMTSEELAKIDDVTRSLAERVMSLRREKDIVYRKIQEAQQDELSRQEQKMQLQRNMHAQRKEALLETLHELRDRLEEQSKILKQRRSSKESVKNPDRNQ